MIVIIYDEVMLCADIVELTADPVCSDVPPPTFGHLMVAILSLCSRTK